MTVYRGHTLLLASLQRTLTVFAGGKARGGELNDSAARRGYPTSHVLSNRAIRMPRIVPLKGHCVVLEKKCKL